MLEVNYNSVKLALHLIYCLVDKVTYNQYHESTKLTQTLLLEPIN